MTRAPLEEALAGQPRVLAYLERSLDAERAGAPAARGAQGISHAYLFSGNAIVEDAAMALAEVLVCPEGECGASEQDARYARVERGSHPDVKVLEPLSATRGYLLEQVHELIADAALTPIEATRKVYIVKEADTLGTQAANALLKTLEEPAADVVFILCAPSADSVLQTIRSRCSVVPFAAVDTSAAKSALLAGETPERSRMALAIASSAQQAQRFLASVERQETRNAICAFLASREAPSDWSALALAEDIVARAHAEATDSGEADGEDEGLDEFLTRTARQAIEDRKKRATSAAERRGLAEAVRIVETLLRDALAARAPSPEAPFNADVPELVCALAARSDDSLLAALGATERASRHLNRSTTPALVLQVLFLSLKELLWQASVR